MSAQWYDGNLIYIYLLEDLCKEESMKHLFQFSSIFLIATLFIVTSSGVVVAQELDTAATGANSTLKGNVLVSATFSLSQSESENESRLIQNLDDSYRNDWSATLRSGYFIKDNFAIGGYFTYANKLDRLNYTIQP